jgi:hypothetical protein
LEEEEVEEDDDAAPGMDSNEREEEDEEEIEEEGATALEPSEARPRALGCAPESESDRTALLLLVPLETFAPMGLLVAAVALDSSAGTTVLA